MLFTIVPIIIGLTALLVFGGVVLTIMSGLRHRNVLHQMMQKAIHDKQHNDSLKAAAESDVPEKRTDLNCPNCGASCDDGNEVSVSGDFKCPFCGAWSRGN